LLFGPYRLPEPLAAPPELDEPPEALPLPGCGRSLLTPPEPLALPEPLIPLLPVLPERALLSLLPLLALPGRLPSPHAESANAIAAAITPIESFFMIAPSRFGLSRRRIADDRPPGTSPAVRAVLAISVP
jgi:hypothetical protein